MREAAYSRTYKYSRTHVQYPASLAIAFHCHLRVTIAFTSSGTLSLNSSDARFMSRYRLLYFWELLLLDEIGLKPITVRLSILHEDRKMTTRLRVDASHRLTDQLTEIPG